MACRYLWKDATVNVGDEVTLDAKSMMKQGFALYLEVDNAMEIWVYVSIDGENFYDSGISLTASAAGYGLFSDFTTELGKFPYYKFYVASAPDTGLGITMFVSG